MHSEIDLAGKHAFVYLSHEDPKTGELVEGLVQEDVPAGLNLAQLGLDAKALQPLLHDLRLAQCQRAAPRPHDQLFRQERNASRVVSITSWLCAAEMKSVSYWLGVRKMPESSIRRKNSK